MCTQGKGRNETARFHSRCLVLNLYPYDFRVKHTDKNNKGGFPPTLTFDYSKNKLLSVMHT